MQPVEIRQRQEGVAPERLQAATGVARAVAQDRAAHAVGDARLEALEAARRARPTRWPATSPTRGAAVSSAPSSAGMKDGSFCPSPSSVATIGARAAATPVRTAADWPQEAACLIWRSHGRSAFSAVSAASVPSRRAVVDVDELEASSGPVKRGRDLVDQRPDIAGFVAHRHHHRHGRASGVSGVGSGISVVRLGHRPPGVLSADQPRRQPLLMRRQRRARQRAAPPVRVDREARPARREPVAHQDRAERAAQGRRDHVARDNAP